MSYNNIGLSSVRGTATSGHIQTNKSHISKSSKRYKLSQVHRNPQKDVRPFSIQPMKKRQANAELQKHSELRRLENSLLELRERLEDEGKLTEDQLDAKIDEERSKTLKRWKDQEDREREWREAQECKRLEAAKAATEKEEGEEEEGSQALVPINSMGALPPPK